MVPELVLVAEISRFSLREHSCLGNLILPAFSLWRASSLGDFSGTAASIDTALDVAFWVRITDHEDHARDVDRQDHR